MKNEKIIIKKKMLNKISMVDEGNKVMDKRPIKREKFIPSMLGKRKQDIEKRRSCAMRRRDVASIRTYSLAVGKPCAKRPSLCKRGHLALTG